MGRRRKRRKKRRTDRDRRVFRRKAVAGDDPVVGRSNLESISSSMEERFTQAGAIEPPIDPVFLVRLLSMSNVLRPCIDTMVQNVHAGGHHFEPVIDLSASNAKEMVADAMILEREYKAFDDALANDEPTDEIDVDEPTDKEIAAKIVEIKKRQRRESAKLRFFFRTAAEETSFVRLRRRMATDEECIGWGVWEVRRDRRGEPRRLKYGQAYTFRALPPDEAIEVESRVPISDIAWAKEKEWREFRRFVQIHHGNQTWFKEFEDPRIISARTGEVFETEEALQEAEGSEGKKAVAATELLWFKLDTPESDIYGLPRYAGALLSVIGSREMEEINLQYFDNKAIPPLACLVSGGRIAEDAKEEIAKLVQNQIKGKENFHRILVLQAEPYKKGTMQGQPAQGQTKIELVPLTEAIFKDAIWQEYDKENRNKVGESFRIPPLLRGVTKDFNRATALAALEYSEKMVFATERADFDFDMNERLLRALGISMWRFVSNPPRAEKNEQVVDQIVKLVDAIISPNEGRAIISRVFDMELPRIDKAWANVPRQYAVAGMGATAPPADSDDERDDYDGQPSNLADDDDIDARRKRGIPIDQVFLPQDQLDRLFVSVEKGERDATLIPPGE